MATWIYEARTGEGRVVRGTREADDRRSALEALRAEGLFPTRLETRGARRAPAKPAPLRPRAPVPDSPPSALSPSSVGANAVGGAAIAVEPSGAARPANAPNVGAANGAPDVSAPRPPVARPAVPHFDPNAGPPGGAGGATGRIDPNVLRPLGQSVSAPLARQPFLRASDQDLSNFFRQLAALIHAGTGIGAALKTLGEHGGGRALRSASKQMAERAMTGEPLSESMKSFPGLFTPLMVGIMSAGERGGFLETSLNRLADYSERDYELQQSIKRETWYPKTIFFFSFAIAGVPTLVLAGVVPFLRQVIPPYLVIGGVVLAWKAWNFARPALVSGAIEPLKVGGTSPAKIYDEIKLVLPIVGKTARALASAKFCRALGTLYSAGVSPGEAVRLGAQACGNRVVAERALKTIPGLQAGRSLTECMAETRVFNPLALQMMRVGEESGDLDSQLDKAADFLETNAETTIKQAVPVLGILLYLCVAFYVALQLISFYTGYYGGIMDNNIE